MSLTATHSMSVSVAKPARSTFRPMRPKPLIPTRTGMCQSLLRCLTKSARRLPRAGGPPHAPGRAALTANRSRARATRRPDRPDIRSSSRVADGAGARRAAVAAPGGDARPVRGVDRAPPGGGDGDMAAGGGGAVGGAPRGAVGRVPRGAVRRARHEPQLGAVPAVADAVGRVDDAPAA